MKKILTLTVSCALLVLIGCDTSHHSNSALDSLATDSTKLTLDTGERKAETAWNFHEDVNKMDDSKIYYAELVSTNQLNLSFPYNGDNAATLEIRKKEGTNNVILLIDKGQFIEGVYGTSVRVRFDGNKPEIFSCSRSTDYDSKILFINSTSRFISKLKKSKKIIIEATLYQDGNQQMEFNTVGFNWEH